MIKEAKEKSLLEVMGTQEMLTIPYFQRKYVWKEENWEEMFETVISEKEGAEKDTNNIYWGNIIWKEIDTKQGQSKCYKIIDGQQRITTLSILLLSIYNSIKQKKPKIIEKIKNILLVNNNLMADSDEDADIKLVLSVVDKQDYYDLVEPLKKDKIITEEKLKEESKYSSKIKECYKYFIGRLKEYRDEELYELFEICISNEKRFVLITLDKDTQNEQSIFDTINRAGQRLTNAEIIKNNLYERINKIKDINEEDVVKLCNDNWDNIFELDDNTDDNRWYGNEKIGNNVWTRIEHLMYFIAMIEWKTDSPLNLANVYTKEINKIEDENKIQEFAKKIKDYAMIYKKYIMDFDDKSPVFAGEDLNNKVYYYRTLLVIVKCDLKMMYPYLLKLLYDCYDKDSEECDIENNEFVEEMKQIYKFVLRNNICDMNYSNGITKTVINIINSKTGIRGEMENAKKEKDTQKSKYEESESELEKNLKNVNRNIATLILFLIELDHFNDAKDINMTYVYELEHIMPIKWEKYWGNEYQRINDNTEEGRLKKEDFKRKRDEHIKYIGNMLLIRKSLNASIKNRELEIKIKGDEKKEKNRHKGYNDCCAMYLVNDFVKNYGDKKKWDEKEIEKRTNAIIKVVKEMCEW